MCDCKCRSQPSGCLTVFLVFIALVLLANVTGCAGTLSPTEEYKKESHEAEWYDEYYLAKRQCNASGGRIVHQTNAFSSKVQRDSPKPGTFYSCVR